MKPAERLVRSLGWNLLKTGNPIELLNSLERLARSLSQHEALEIVGDPGQSGRDLREALVEALPGLHPSALELAVTLATEGRIDLFAPVADWVAGVLRRAGAARVWSAAALTDGQAARLSDALVRLAGGPVEMEVRVEPALIAGIIVQLGSRRWDFSASGALRHLGRYLTGV